jgi:aspartyl-tRNA(Asn)/glutamyl-tRNA(Gln) amidotransferase subunit A
MKQIIMLPFREILNLIKKREVSCEEIMNETLMQIEKYDHILDSFISVHNRSELINKAKESDKKRKNNQQSSEIEGIPIALKDNMHSMGFNTTCGSKILHNYNPPYDSTVAARIKEKGGIIIGKTNLDEFAMGSTTENSAIKKTKNPFDIERVPGGSSGGSACAISSGMSVLALGSDTGGSIRQPASFCGITGIKPTYGLVSRYGLVAYASSLDQIGTFSRDIFGCAHLLDIIAGFDSKDSTSLDVKKLDLTQNIGKPIKGLKIAIIPELFNEGITPGIKSNFLKSLDLLKDLGVEIKEVKFDAIKYVISTYYFIATAEACSNLSRYDGVKYGFRSPKQLNYDEMLLSTRSYGFGKEVKKRILLGNFVLSSGYYDEYYRKAQKVRAHIMEELKSILDSFDAIAMPTAPDIAFKFGESVTDPMKMYLSDVTTAIANLTGLPAISIPCGKVDNMPVGLQLIGKPLGESVLFQIGDEFERKLNMDFTPPLEKIDGYKKDEDEVKTIDELIPESSLRYSKEDIKKVSASYKNRAKNISDRILCADLEKYLGKKIRISGWVHKINSLGGIEFYILRDRTGMTQVVLQGNISASKVCLETVIEVEGLVTKEDRSQYDNIEIKAESLKILGLSSNDLPININGNLSNMNLPTILDYRGLSLRNPKILRVFKYQSELVRLFGEFLRNNDFTEIKTSKIISTGTEGGTNLFELKYFDRVAFLAQSPQFYKQTMVGSGFERVFEIAPVFRAEIHNTIRHLNEYISLDFEMGFIKDEQDIIDMQENLLKYMLSEMKKLYGDEIKKEFGADIIIPENFPRIHFLEALEIGFKAGVKDMDGDISPEGERAVCEYVEKEYNSPFVYIVGYPVKKRPMYTKQDERLPGYTRSFDLLYKGLEITTGGQRINDYEALRKNIIAFGGNPGSFKSYLEIFKFGMPPHGGLGMGLERITMKMLGLSNVREASLFPRDINRLHP